MAELSIVHYLCAAGAFSIYAYLLYRGRKAGMLRPFAVFYAYVGATAVGELVNWAVILSAGYSSAIYFYTYHATGLLHTVFQVDL